MSLSVPSSRPEFRVASLLALGCTVAAAFVLCMPGAWIPQIPDWAEAGAHAVTLGGVALAWGLVFPRRLAIVAGASVLAALGSELVQAYVVPLRTGAADDFAADLVGIAVALAVAAGVRRARAA